MEGAAQDRLNHIEDDSLTPLPPNTTICDCEPGFGHFSPEMLQRIEHEQPASMRAMRSCLEQDSEYRSPAHAQSHVHGASDASNPPQLLDTSFDEEQICAMLMIFARSLPSPPYGQQQIKDYIRALHFVEHVTAIYPSFYLHTEEKPRISQVAEALQKSFTHRKSSSLWEDIVAALDRNPDLLSKFRAYMLGTGFQTEYWSQNMEPEIWETWYNRLNVETWQMDLDAVEANIETNSTSFST